MIALVFQVIFIVLFAIFVDYDKDSDASYDMSAVRKDYHPNNTAEEHEAADGADLSIIYPSEFNKYFQLLRNVDLLPIVCKVKHSNRVM